MDDIVQLKPSQAPAPKRNSLLSRNVTVSGHRTSMRLEPDMWRGLSEICRRERATLHEVCTAISLNKAPNVSLTAATRVFIMAYYRAAATEDGHARSGHGRGITMIAVTSATAPQMQARTMGAPQSQTAASSPYMIGTGYLNGNAGR
jgi:predicted DNA-binding ribbon-helix-helix protein